MYFSKYIKMLNNVFRIDAINVKIMLQIKKNSMVFSFLGLILLLMTNKVSLAVAQCTVNGEEVPCEEMKSSILGLGLGIGFIFLLIIAFGIFSLVFWILMIIHATKYNVDDKAMWIILMIFTGFIGALVYYFVVKRKYVEPTSSVSNISSSISSNSDSIPPSTPSAQ